jgi:DNA-binding transcriptional LysR family regulator
MGSFSRAAQLLNLSQPTVSQHIANLESVLGTLLLRRERKNLPLTEGGRIFLQYAQKMTDLREKAMAAVRSVSETVSGPLQVGGSTIPGTYIVPALLSGFLSAYPRVQVHLEVRDTAEIVRGVREGTFDVGVTGARLSESRLQWETFAKDRILLALPLDHPLASRRSILPRDLPGETLVHREEGSGTRKAFEEALRKAGVDTNALKAVCTLGSTEAMKQAVATGLGIGYLSDRSLTGVEKIDRIHTLPMQGLRVTRTFYVVARGRGLAEDGPARAFFDFLLHAPT